jgi:hypothetical protein
MRRDQPNGLDLSGAGSKGALDHEAGKAQSSVRCSALSEARLEAALLHCDAEP